MLSSEAFKDAVQTVLDFLTSFEGPTSIDIATVVDKLNELEQDLNKITTVAREDIANIWGNAAVKYNQTLFSTIDIMDFDDVRKAVKRAMDKIPPSVTEWVNIETTATVQLISKLVNQFPAFWQFSKEQELAFHKSFRQIRAKVADDVREAVDKLFDQFF
jgi:hypothetical protein